MEYFDMMAWMASNCPLAARRRSRVLQLVHAVIAVHPDWTRITRPTG